MEAQPDPIQQRTITGTEIEELVKIALHLRELHSPSPEFKSLCDICLFDAPCHTRVDIERIIEILG